MKRKARSICAVLSCLMAFQSLSVPVLAEGTMNAGEADTVYENVVYDSIAEETGDTETTDEVVSSQAIATDSTTTTVEDADAKVEVYADGTFANVTLTSTDGQKYTLVVQKQYEYENYGDVVKVGAKITNIAQDASNMDMVIPESVTVDGEEIEVISIGNAAFNGCKAKSIIVPNTVLEIGDNAFSSSKNLQKFTVSVAADTPKYLMDDGESYDKIPTSIGDNILSDCTALKSAYITNFENIGNETFKGCTSLTDANISIDGYAVQYDGSYNMDEPRLVEHIGDRTFYDCSSLVQAKLDDKISSIGSETYLGCKQLQTLYIGANLSSSSITYEDFIVPNTLENSDILDAVEAKQIDSLLSSNKAEFEQTACTNFKSFSVSDDNDELTAIDGILYAKDEYNVLTDLIYVPIKVGVTSLTLDDNVSRIGSYALYRNETLKSLTANAVYGSVDDPSHLDFDSSYTAFASNIENLYIGYRDDANRGSLDFAFCNNLKSAVLNGTYLRDMCFYYDKNLKTVEIYIYGSQSGSYNMAESGIETVKAAASFGENTYLNCLKLKTAETSGAGFETGGSQFVNCPELVSVSTPSMLGLPTYYIKDAPKLTTLKLRGDIQEISSYALDNCPSLVKIDGVDSSCRFLVRIEENAFNDCPKLSAFTFTRSVMDIADNPFGNNKTVVISTPKGWNGDTWATKHGYSVKYIEQDIEDAEFIRIQALILKDEEGNDLPPEEVTVDSEAGWTLLSSVKYPERYGIIGYHGGFKSLDLSNYSGINFFMEFQPLGSYSGMEEHLTDFNTGSIKYIFANLGGFDKLKTVKMPNVGIIGSSAFNGCDSLVSADFPVVSKIGSYAFNGCPSLIGDSNKGAIQLPLTLTEIGDNAFAGCTSIKRVDTVLDKSVLESGNVARKLTMGEYAFAGCLNLESFNKSFVELDVAGDINKFNINYYLKNFGNYAFSECPDLNYVFFNANLETVGENAFENCTGLTAVTIDNSAFFEKDAFIGCTNLANAIIYGEANVSQANDPFSDIKVLTIATTKESKGASYAGYKNQTTGNDFTANIREFATINGKAYVKSYVVASNDINVFKNGVAMKFSSTPEEYQVDGHTVYKSTDTVLYTDKLEFKPKKDGYSAVVNGKAFKDGEEYEVTEVESGIITVYADELPEFLYGDADGDGFITASDAAFVLQKALVSTFKLPVEEKSANGTQYADADADGSITASDAAFILQKALVSTFRLPAEDKARS